MSLVKIIVRNVLWWAAIGSSAFIVVRFFWHGVRREPVWSEALQAGFLLGFWFCVFLDWLTGRIIRRIQRNAELMIRKIRESR